MIDPVSDIINNNIEKIKEELASKSVSKNDINHALHYSVFWNNSDIAKLMLENGANPNFINEHNKNSLVSLAIQQRHPNMLSLLIENKADVNISFLNNVQLSDDVPAKYRPQGTILDNIFQNLTTTNTIKCWDIANILLENGGKFSMDDKRFSKLLTKMLNKYQYVINQIDIEDEHKLDAKLKGTNRDYKIGDFLRVAHKTFDLMRNSHDKPVNLPAQTKKELGNKFLESYNQLESITSTDKIANLSRGNNLFLNWNPDYSSQKSTYSMIDQTEHTSLIGEEGIKE